VRAGDAWGIPVLAFLIRTPEWSVVPGKLPEGGTICAGSGPRGPSIKRSRCVDGDSLPVRASMPVVDPRRPRLRSLTAIASGWTPSRCPQNLLQMAMDCHLLPRDSQPAGILYFVIPAKAGIQ
jgi:hypothetical protein